MRLNLSKIEQSILNAGQSRSHEIQSWLCFWIGEGVWNYLTPDKPHSQGRGEMRETCGHGLGGVGRPTLSRIEENRI
jgi:hypothetical protein